MQRMRDVCRLSTQLMLRNSVQISQLSGAQAGSLFEFIPEPTAVTFPEGVRVKQLVSGPRHNFAVSTDGRLFSFGFSPHKALGFSEGQSKSGSLRSGADSSDRNAANYTA